MRKPIVTPTPATAHAQKGWLDLECAATVEVTSENKDFPIESSFSVDPRQGWRAAQPGTQTTRLVFDEPQELKCIPLVFEESDMRRIQLELTIMPDISGGAVRASLRSLRLS